MNVVVLINGREAIPVRAIPYVADTTVSARVLVRGLLGADHVNSLHGLSAYKHGDGGRVISVSAVEWRHLTTKLQALSDGLNRKKKNGELTDAEGAEKWKRESVRLLPSGVFLWKDEFQREHFKSFRRLSNDEVAQNHRSGIEMQRELVSAPDDSYTAELMAAHQMPENWREVVQADIDEAAAEGPFNPGDYCIYVPNRCEPKGTDALSDVTFYPMIEQDEMLVVMQGFEHIDESTSQTAGEIAQMLGKWFDRPIGDLPPKLREIAEAYIPNWPELSGADRRAQADEADRQLQATLGARFEKSRREAEQANAATPDRFKARDFQDGFNRVQRTKNGERDFEAKRFAVNLSDERCVELAHSHELRIADWIELTGVGIGECVAYLITKEGVSFRAWDDDHISSAPVDWQIDMERDNEQPPLKFPCAPIELLHFVDTARHDLYGFSVPDAFRQAVTESAQATDTAPQIRNEAQEQTAPSAMKKAQTKLCQILTELERYADESSQPFDRHAMPGPLGDGPTKEGSFHWLCASIDRIFSKAQVTFERYRNGICAVAPRARPTDFYRSALPHIASKLNADQKSRNTNKP